VQGSSPRRAPARAPAGTPTKLNVWVLGNLADGRREFPNKFGASDAPHLRRCRDAGFVEVSGGTLRLTCSGIAAVNADETVRFVSVEE
jgi:hypothetical protein